MSAIGNCPWCNHRAILFSNLAREVTFFRCNNQLCGAQGPEMSTRDLAITAWNRLATPGQGEVRGRVRWEADRLYLGSLLLGRVTQSVERDGEWRSSGVYLGLPSYHPTEAAARAALEAAVREAINAD